MSQFGPSPVWHSSYEITLYRPATTPAVGVNFILAPNLVEYRLPRADSGNGRTRILSVSLKRGIGVRTTVLGYQHNGRTLDVSNLLTASIVATTLSVNGKDYVYYSLTEG